MKLSDSCHHIIVLLDYIKEAVFNILPKSNGVVRVGFRLPVVLNTVKMDRTCYSIAKH